MESSHRTVDAADEMDRSVYDTPWWASTAAVIALFLTATVVLPRLLGTAPVAGYAVAVAGITAACVILWQLLDTYRHTR
jgi:hypothetical protein